MRNLIPVVAGCLCLALIVYSCIHAGTYAIQSNAVAVQMNYVKNAHESERRWLKRRLDSIQNSYKQIAGPNEVLTRKELVAKGLFKGNWKATYEEREAALNAYLAIDKRYFDAQEDIKEYRTNHPKGFGQLNQLYDHKRRKITVYVGRDPLPGYERGITKWKYDEEFDQIYMDLKPIGINNAFLVYIQSDEPSAGFILAHEKGHIMDILKDPAGYWKDSAKWTAMNCQEPGSWSNRYVAPARDAEAEYTRESKNIYKRKVYGTTD